MTNFKEIHIGNMIEKRVTECGMDISRICSFMKCSKEEIIKMYEAESLDAEALLRWSKLLEYDFFRIYTQHLILYAPPSPEKSNCKKTALPQFRKNIYTREIIDFILELIESGKKTKLQVIDDYRIPKTTLYKWIEKYRKTTHMQT
ncbi:hypothetical protein CLU97_0473 [Chryseobacterium sp. 7]|uniref:transposase n=1 Tax=Chryseobacterium sp. 7 TaxID=2035214 RepID=UPI000EB32662|nr:transposase [Chryseobacterium sp. 7]RLJ31071.1 hypothetical protein CLU97_0473 [Chryseobacterium sp. 7]